MADRTIAPIGDSFVIWTAVIASLTTQFILTLLGVGIGIVSLGYAAGSTVGWGGLVWWGASGIFAAAMGGTLIAALGEGIDDARKAILALLAWALSILIVAFATAMLAGGGASILSVWGGPVAVMLDTLADGKVTEEMRRSISALAVGSVVALALGAAAQVATAIYAPESNVRTKRTA